MRDGLYTYTSENAKFGLDYLQYQERLIKNNAKLSSSIQEQFRDIQECMAGVWLTRGLTLIDHINCYGFVI